MRNLINLNKVNKSTVVLLCSLLLIGVSITGVFAYLMDADKANNVTVVGGNRIEIVEEFDPPDKIEPNVEFTKDVSVNNVGLSDCFVRVKAVFTDSDMEKYCTVDFNSSEDASDNTVDYWYNKEDGYYYLKEILESGERSASLFTKIKISEDIPANEIKDFDVLVYVESYQSEGFTDYKDAWTHYHRNNPSNS